MLIGYVREIFEIFEQRTKDPLKWRHCFFSRITFEVYYNFHFLHSCCFISLIGLRPGDEIVVLNGCEVCSLDLALIQTLFNDQSLQLTVKRHPPSVRRSPDTVNAKSQRRDNLQNHQRAKSSTGREEHMCSRKNVCCLSAAQFFCQHINVFTNSDFSAQ